MHLNVGDVIQIMEAIAPSHLAEDWDNVGLQAGRMDWPVRSIWVALDPTPEVMDAACQAGADLLITHHPLIFKPLQKVDFATPEGKVVRRAVLDQTAVFAAHTNLDSAKEGLNDLLARKIGLKRISVLKPRVDLSKSDVDPIGKVDATEGLGRIGSLDANTTLAGLALRVKEVLDLVSIQVAGRPDLPVRKVAVCTGSGGSLLPAFLSSAADVYLSGDLTYHNGRVVEAVDRGLIDIGHFASEHIVVEDLSRRIRQVLAQTGEKVAVTACTLEKDPFSRV
ncbi:MAG: Nif3-like dinuclear metal center hexameric protein [Thermodesulfobacteriota bacterium]|nr:Nif3-like dinuclear metal center hexameric protein [Thermodesulfobacteriota bacterium]